MLANLVGLGDPLVLDVAAGGIFAARRLQIGLPRGVRADGETGDQLLEFLAVTRRADSDRGLEHNQLEFFPASAAFVIEDRHGLEKILANGAAACPIRERCVR